MKKLQELIDIAEELELDGREILDRFTETELLGIYNGLGPDRFPDWLREFITSLNSIFEPAALIHDVDFHLGGTKEDFDIANERFRENCYKIVESEYPWYSPLRYHYLFKAWRFYGYCEEFGWEGYHKK